MQDLNVHPDQPERQSGIGKKTAAEEALQKSRERFVELSQRVNERTSELVRANDQLKQEVQDRRRIERRFRDKEAQYQKDVEAALKESERQYRRLVESIPHGIQEMDPGGVITFANPAIHRIFGYGDGELIGKSIMDLAASKKDQKALGRFLAQMINGQKDPVPYQYKCLTKEGRVIDIQTEFNYKLDHQGRTTGFISTIRDISKRNRAEQEKQALEKQLYHAQKMEAIGTLAGGIAHDFNNILGSILLNAELAIDDLPEDCETQYSLNQVVKGCLHAKDLIEQILTFSREAEFERRPLQINVIVKETLKMLRAMFPATIAIEQGIENGLKGVLADPTQIQQLVINLCNNAAHAMGASGGQLMVELANAELDSPPSGSDLQPGSYVKLIVSDMGCGIRPEIREHIFDPFFTTKRPGEGTGLGLSVVHGIVMNHDGAIVMDSETGKGTTFQVFLPAIGDTRVSTKESAPQMLPTGSEKILFVDDEEVVVDANKRILERLGYNVCAAMSGNEALRMFSMHPESFDLIITDMTMPGMTGIELATELTQIRPDLPIILCTGYSQMINPESINALGIQEFIIKPFNRSEIAAVIRKVLEKS